MKKVLPILVIVGFIFTSAASAGVPTSGLVAEYLFSGDATNSSGNWNDGTVSGATLTEDRFGNSSSAYDFDGSNDYIDIDYSSSMDVESAITISVWAKIDGSSSGAKIIARSRNNGLYDDPYSIDLKDGNIRITFYNSSQTNTILYYRYNLGEWIHIAGTFDGSNCKMYINGDLEDTSSLSGNLMSSTLGLGIGDSADGGDQYPFDGEIDDVRIYNRALSASDIEDLYNESDCDCDSSGGDYNEGYDDGYDEGYAAGLAAAGSNDTGTCDGASLTMSGSNFIIKDLNVNGVYYSFDLDWYSNPNDIFGYYWKLDFDSIVTE